MYKIKKILLLNVVAAALCGACNLLQAKSNEDTSITKNALVQTQTLVESNKVLGNQEVDTQLRRQLLEDQATKEQIQQSFYNRWAKKIWFGAGTVSVLTLALAWVALKKALDDSEQPPATSMPAAQLTVQPLVVDTSASAPGQVPETNVRVEVHTSITSEAAAGIQAPENAHSCDVQAPASEYGDGPEYGDEPDDQALLEALKKIEHDQASQEEATRRQLEEREQQQQREALQRERVLKQLETERLAVERQRKAQEEADRRAAELRRQQEEAEQKRLAVERQRRAQEEADRRAAELRRQQQEEALARQREEAERQRLETERLERERREKVAAPILVPGAHQYVAQDHLCWDGTDGKHVLGSRVRGSRIPNAVGPAPVVPPKVLRSGVHY
jgi:hypothetical protein